MFPLATPQFPTNRDELTQSLREGLSAVCEPAEGRPAVAADGSFPSLDRLDIDVTGASLRPEYRPAPATGPRRPGVTAGLLQVAGRPVRFESAGLTFELSARDARLDFAEDANGRKLLEPADARDGHLRARVTGADLKALLLAVGRTAAGPHGVKVEDAEVTLTCDDERTVGVDLRVTASKKVVLTAVRATVRGRGRLTIDDQLNATLSDLDCEGEGMVGMMVVGLLRDRLDELEGRTFPLTAFSLGSLKLRDLKIRCTDGLEVEAAFGS